MHAYISCIWTEIFILKKKWNSNHDIKIKLGKSKMLQKKCKTINHGDYDDDKDKKHTL